MSSFGIFAKTFPRSTVEEVFAAVAGHGLRTVQFNFACAGLPSLPESLEPEEVQRIRHAADTHGIAIAAVSGTFNMIHPLPEQRGDGLRKLRVIASACEALGAKVITICTGTRDAENMWRAHPDNATPAAWRDLLATLTQSISVAEEFDLTLAVEPETANVIHSARQARRLLDEMKSPRLQVVMDAANLLHPGDVMRQRAVFDEAFDLLGAELVLAHAKELAANGHPGELPLGAGVLDWDHYLGRLRAAKFTGPLIMHGFPETGAQASVRFLREKGL